MVLFKLVSRNVYHKNGTQWFGKIFNRIIGEKNYDTVRIQKRIFYAKFWYMKQNFLLRFQTQWPHIAMFFSLLNKHDTSKGFPIGRPYERHQDFAVFNINHEGWFQLYFFVAAAVVLLWNWFIIALNYLTRGDNVSDQDLYRMSDARVTTNFDRTKYKFNLYFFASHQNAVVRKALDNKDHPDNPRVSDNIVQ
jgi:hypothetical protein